MKRSLAGMPALVLALAALSTPSCKRREEDEAAKRRIFSPEEPVGALAEAKEPIDARALADDAPLAARVLHMPQAEIEARVGPHRAEQRVQFAWFRGPGLADGGSDLSLAEETALLQGPGGDFTLKLQNDRNQGFELVRVKGEVFVRSLFGVFHKRRTDRTDPVALREKAMAGLATFDRLARGLKLRLERESTVEGRKVLRYAAAGFGARPRQGGGSELPPVAFPISANGVHGPDPDTARRLEVWEKEVPTEVSGTVLVDAQTGAPLGCDLKGRFKVPTEGKEPAAAELHLRAVLVVQAVGQDPRIQQPPWEPDPSVPHAVKDPLRFLGKAKAPPGAPSSEEAGEEPEEEAQ